MRTWQVSVFAGVTARVSKITCTREQLDEIIDRLPVEWVVDVFDITEEVENAS